MTEPVFDERDIWKTEPSPTYWHIDVGIAVYALGIGTWLILFHSRHQGRATSQGGVRHVYAMVARDVTR